MSSIKCITLEEEMKKNSELKMSDIEILREWCEKQPHLPKIQDVQLAIFLHSNYYKIEPTKSTIENYYTIRTHWPEFFSKEDVLEGKKLEELYNVTAFCHLEAKTKEDYNMIIGQHIDLEPSHFDINNAMKCLLMVIDEYVWSHGSTPGFIYVGDANGISFGHVARYNPTSIKKFMCYVQDALPIRLKGIHVINMSPIIEIIFNLFKPVLKTELLQLIHFHSSMESASKYIPIDALPSEHYGKAGPMQELANMQIKKLEKFREWFLEDERINRVNESLRIGKSKTSNDLFGTEGSFRKIEID